MSAILYINFHLHGGVKAAEHFFCNFYSCKDSLLLDEELALAVGISRDTTKCGMVAIAYIFSESEVDKAVVEFFYR